MGNSPESSDHELESGYVSGASSAASLSTITFTKPQLKHINAQLANLEPIDILRWAKQTLPNLYQTTALGLSGLVALDILSKLAENDPPSTPKIDLIFLDTLYHFSETHDLLTRIQERYPNINVHIYKPAGLPTTAAFEAKHGKEFWLTNPDRYDYLAKVEPAQRAYADLGVSAVLTGRRRSQGAKRADLPVVEVDDLGIVKVNPMLNWSFDQVQAYIRANDVPYNTLLDQGYKSVGDWHSTQPVAQGEDERAGRWKGQDKTECGIHNKPSRYAQYLRELEEKEQAERLQAALSAVPAAAAS